MKTKIMKNQKKSFVTYFVMMFALILTTVSSAQAAVFVVNSDADQKDSVPGDGVCAAVDQTCTLRAAVEEANALKYGDTVKFSSSFEEPNAPKTIVLTLGQLEVNETLFITGPGARQLAIDGNHSSRVLYFANSVQNAFVSGVTIQNGYRYIPQILAYSAGICNFGHYLALSNVTVRDNVAAGDNPNLGEGGGGIFNSQLMTLFGSTIVGNKAAYGGGIWNTGTLNVVNSTISGNVSQNGGGGIYSSDGKTTITNSTVTDNQATTTGGGIYSGKYGTVEMINTIVADNDAQFNNDVSGKINSLGNNLVKSRANSSGYVASDLPNGTDPLLGVLQNNGGQTDTRELLAGSPAINAGNNCVSDMPNCLVGVGNIFYDQRGPSFPRRVGSAIDIGAFESVATRATTVHIGGSVLKPNNRGLNNAVVTLTLRSGESRTAQTDSAGRYSFDDVPTGATYIVKVESRQYEYAPQTLLVEGDRDDVNFVPIGK